MERVVSTDREKSDRPVVIASCWAKRCSVCEEVSSCHAMVL
jgi:hypothetical protein